MDDGDLILYLWQKGAFWCPASPDCMNVEEAHLAKLSLQDDVVKQAVINFQQADDNFSTAMRARHGRSPIFDGIVGPATRSMMSVPRCPMPDFPPPVNTKFTYDDPALQSAVESYQRFAASGTGSFPAAGCDPEKMGVHSIRVKLDLSRASSTVKGYLIEALNHVIAAYAEIGLAVRYVTEGKGEIEKSFAPLFGTIIGWNEFPQANTCNQTVKGKLDSGFSPSMLMWAGLECHETGHGVGLQHTRGGIMNPSLISVSPLSYKNGPSFEALKKYFGGEPLVPPVPPLPLDFLV